MTIPVCQKNILTKPISGYMLAGYNKELLRDRRKTVGGLIHALPDRIMMMPAMILTMIQALILLSMAGIRLLSMII